MRMSCSRYSKRMLGARVFQVLVLHFNNRTHTVYILLLAKSLMSQLLFEGSLPGRWLVEYFCWCGPGVKTLRRIRKVAVSCQEVVVRGSGHDILLLERASRAVTLRWAHPAGFPRRTTATFGKEGLWLVRMNGVFSLTTFVVDFRFDDNLWLSGANYVHVTISGIRRWYHRSLRKFLQRSLLRWWALRFGGWLLRFFGGRRHYWIRNCPNWRCRSNSGLGRWFLQKSWSRFKGRSCEGWFLSISFQHPFLHLL